ncbi:hypothetical protein N8Z24_00185 [bacterium]|nr:hypothetical protein [bacterium]
MGYKFKTKNEAESMSKQVKNIAFGEGWYISHKVEGDDEKGFDILVKVSDNGLVKAKLRLSRYRGIRFKE